MQQFKLKENGAKEISRQNLKTTIPIVILSIIGGGVIFIAGTDEVKPFDVYRLLGILLVIFTILFFNFGKGMTRQCSVFEKYLLTIT